MSLYRERRNESLALSREAERAIGRHVTTRWSVAAVTVAFAAVVATFGWMAGVSAAGGGDSDVNPTHPGNAIPAVAHVPVLGGPQYVHPWGGLECGDPMPPAHPEAPDQRLSLDLVRSEPGMLVTGSLTWSAPETRSTARRKPVIGVGFVLVVAVHDGIVAGMRILLYPTSGWQQFGKDATATAPVTLDAGQFACVTFDEQTQQYVGDAVTLDPGTYEAFAVTRVFATPESVALFQALTDTDLVAISEDYRQPGGVYEAGSADCRALRSRLVSVRACLPDVIPTATLDEDAGTVRMLYDASALPQEFDVTLVSEPLTMVID